MDLIEQLRQRAANCDLPHDLDLIDRCDATDIIKEVKRGRQLNEEEASALIRTLSCLTYEYLSQIEAVWVGVSWTETKRQLQAFEKAAKKLHKAAGMDRAASDILERAYLSVKHRQKDALHPAQLPYHLKLLIEAAAVACKLGNPEWPRNDTRTAAVEAAWFRELGVIWELLTGKTPKIAWDGIRDTYTYGQDFVAFVQLCSIYDRHLDPQEITVHNIPESIADGNLILPRTDASTGLPKAIQNALKDKSALEETRKRYAL